MKKYMCNTSLLGVLLALVPAFALAQSDDTIKPNDGTKYHSQRTGRLTDRLGELITIEGTQPEGSRAGKGSATSLRVDTVNGVKLTEPRNVPISGFRIPKDIRCVLKGYETGSMIGTPPAMSQAAKEQGKKPPIPSQAAYQWYTDFVVLIVVEPHSKAEAPQKPEVPSDGTKSRVELLASDVLSADVDFDIETGSFLLKYAMKEGAKRTIVLEYPGDNKVKSPRILLRGESNTNVESEVFQEQDFESFIRKRLMEGEVSKEEAGFIAVLVLAMQKKATVQGWGFSSVSIMIGDWQKVFSKPISGLLGPKGGARR